MDESGSCSVVDFVNASDSSSDESDFVQHGSFLYDEEQYEVDRPISTEKLHLSVVMRPADATEGWRELPNGSMLESSFEEVSA